MKILLMFVCLFVNLYAGGINLSNNEADELIRQRVKFFTQVFLVQYDKTKASLDINKKLHYIDLCKYPLDSYQFPCGNINGEEVGIRKYFIKAKNIEQAYNRFKTEYNLPVMPKTNLYDYGGADSNKEDGVGNYYIWDNQGRFWVIGMGYDSGSIIIYTQRKEYIEVICQWSVEW